MASVPADARAFLEKYVASIGAKNAHEEVSPYFHGDSTTHGGAGLHEHLQKAVGSAGTYSADHHAGQTVIDIYVSSHSKDKYIVTTRAENGDERAAEIHLSRSSDGLKIKHLAPFYAHKGL